MDWLPMVVVLNYDPRWGSVGLWDSKALVLEEAMELRLDNAALIEASRAISRRIISPTS